MDTGGYTALDFALHDSHVLNANVFHAASRSCWNISRTPVQSLQRRAGDVRTIIIIIIIMIIIIIIYRLRTFNSSMWGSLTLAPIIIIIYRLRTFNSSMWGSLRLAPIIVRL